MRANNSNNERGFTIIELLIATSVFSVMLVLVSAAMINIGRLYTKGMSQSKLQSSVRNISDDVSQQLQLGAQLQPPVTGGSYRAYCIGETRYTFTIGKQLGTGNESDGTPKAKPVLWRDKTPAGGCSVAGLDPAGTELAPTNSRLLAFDISATSPHQVAVGLAYGDMDLLFIDADNPLSIKTNCSGRTGSEYCATAKLTTVAARRITGE